MSRKNTIVGSEYQTLIDERLLSGESYRNISKELEDLGFEISHSAIGNYHKAYLDNRVNPKDVDQYEVEPETFDYKEGIDNYELLAEMYSMSIQRAFGKMKKSINGESRFPSNELKDIKLLDDLMKSNEISRNNPTRGGDMNVSDNQ